MDSKTYTTYTSKRFKSQDYGANLLCQKRKKRKEHNYQNNFKLASVFDVLLAVVMKCSICWDITPCSPLKVSTFWRKMSPPSSGPKNKPSLLPASRWFLARLIIRLRRWRHIPPKRRLTFNGLYDVISRKTQTSKNKVFQSSCLILCSQSGDYEEYYLLGCDAVQVGMFADVSEERTAPSFRVVK
jgi:hypothetical protein